MHAKRKRDRKSLRFLQSIESERCKNIENKIDSATEITQKQNKQIHINACKEKKERLYQEGTWRLRDADHRE